MKIFFEYVGFWWKSIWNQCMFKQGKVCSTENNYLGPNNFRSINMINIKFIHSIEWSFDRIGKGNKQRQCIVAESCSMSKWLQWQKELNLHSIFKPLALQKYKSAKVLMMYWGHRLYWCRYVSIVCCMLHPSTICCFFCSLCWKTLLHSMKQKLVESSSLFLCGILPKRYLGFIIQVTDCIEPVKLGGAVKS